MQKRDVSILSADAASSVAFSQYVERRVSDLKLCMFSVSSSTSLDEIIIIFNAALSATEGSFNRSGHALLVLCA